MDVDMDMGMDVDVDVSAIGHPRRFILWSRFAEDQALYSGEGLDV